MRKSIQKWAYALVTCAFVLALCVSFSACSSDDDNNGTDGIVPVLFSEFDGHYSVLYPLGLTNESVFVNISETLAGQQIDLTKPGDWSSGGSFVGGGPYEYDEHFFQNGSYVYLRKTGDHEIEFRFKYVWKDKSGIKTKEGSYKGKVTIQKDIIDKLHLQGYTAN